MRCFITCSLLILLALPARAEKLALVFEKAGTELKRQTADEISQVVPSTTVTFFNPHAGTAGKVKSYRCWPIKALMDAMYGPKWGEPPYSEVVLTAADGYASQAKAATLHEDGGCLAFEDLDAGGGRWEPVGRKNADPGPYFLIWTKAGQDPAHEYPWPWQLASINLIRFEDRYPEVLPKGAKEGSPEMRGYAIFRGQCMRCHSINQQGGKIGPDLNAPQSVTSYRTREWIKSYVRQPSKYRYTEMPDHTHLTDADLESIYRYFKLKATQPEKDWK
jgi:mono/diheme cytochrome c family protein